MIRSPVSGTLGPTVNPAKLDITNDEVGTGATAAQAGGLVVYSYISAATINATVVTAVPGRLYGIAVANSNAAARYVKLYNQTATPDPSAGHVPIWRHTIGGSSFNAQPPMMFAQGIAFSAGLGFVIVGLLADTDETAVGANDVILHLLYKV